MPDEVERDSTRRDQDAVRMGSVVDRVAYARERYGYMWWLSALNIVLTISFILIDHGHDLGSTFLLSVGCALTAYVSHQMTAGRYLRHAMSLVLEGGIVRLVGADGQAREIALADIDPARSILAGRKLKLFSKREPWRDPLIIVSASLGPDLREPLLQALAAGIGGP